MSGGFPEILCVIPARLFSTRLHAKVILPIAGRPMAWWVWKRAGSILKNVVVATDHPRVKSALLPFGTPVVMTSPRLASGTDRVAEVARKTRFPFYLNIQGDEPLIPPEMVQAVAEMTLKKRRGVFTAAAPLTRRLASNPMIVKVARTSEGRALYFSRAPIPYPAASQEDGACLRHSGIYGYDRKTLLKLSRLAPSPLELRERLEQLRALEHGVPIWVATVRKASSAVDTRRDLARVRRAFSLKASRRTPNG